MQENLDGVSAELLREVLTATQSALEFGKAELPLIVDEILLYKLVFASILFTIMATLSIVSIYLSKRALKLASEGDISEFILVGTTGIIALVLALVQLCTILKITLAPRLFLLEYLSNMLR